MEASDATQAAEAPTQDTGADAGGQQAQVPQEVMQRLDELGGRFDNLEPLLQGLQPQQEAEQEPGFADYFPEDGDYEQGYDVNNLQQAMQAEAQRIAQEQITPLQQQLAQMQQRAVQDDFAGLVDQYPQLADQTFQSQFIPRVEQAAQQMAQNLGLGPEHAQRLLGDPSFVENMYLAGMAREQAQQGVPAGDQGVHLEGGSGNPGQPQVDAETESWQRMASQGASGGMWGKPLSEL